MLIVRVCRLVRGVGSDANETVSGVSESDIGIGEKAANPGRVSESMERGRPRSGDVFLLEPGARKVKSGSPKAGTKAAGVWGDTSLDLERLVHRVGRRGEGDLDRLTSGRGSPAAPASAQNRSMS